MAWLLDTNILSELRRPNPDQRVVTFIAGRPLAELYISTVTFAEIRFGIELVADPTRRYHGLTIVTRDRSDYDKAGVPVVNPWDAS